MQYRADIDGLRAVAVSAVVLHHFELGFSGGFVGVDVFFVISGFLITGLMLKDLDAGTFSLAQFWERRLRRILPALFVVLAASFIVGWFVLAPEAYSLFGQSVCKVVGLTANHHYAKFSGYFNQAAAESPLLHFWSLAVEEQFYLVVPLVFWGVFRCGRSRLLMPLVGATAIVSFVFAAYGVRNEDPAAYFLLATRAWEILAGTALALALHRRAHAEGSSLPQAWRDALAAAALAAILLPCFAYDRHTPFPAPGALPPVLGAAILTGLGAGSAGNSRSTWVHRLLASPPLVAAGLASYSLYLWHWPVWVFFQHYCLRAPTISERLAMIVVSAGLTMVSYRGVEVPFRRRDLLAGRTSLFSASAVAVLLLHFAGTHLRSTGGVAQRLPPQAMALVATGVLDQRCHTAHLAADVPDRLLKLGVEQAEPRLLVWGDSHCGAILTAVDRVCREAEISGVAVVHHGRSPVAEHLSNESPRTYAEATALAAAVNDYVRNSSIQDVVLVANWTLYRAHPRFQAALLDTVDGFRAAGRRVFFMKGIPTFDYDLKGRLTQCAWHGRDATSITGSMREYEEVNRDYVTLLPALAAHGAIILDPLPELQTGKDSSELQTCDAQGLIYSDRAHLSIYGSKVVEPTFRRAFVARVPDSEPEQRLLPTSRGKAMVVDRRGDSETKRR